MRVYTTAKQYGEDAVLSATEIVRRAERGIGVALRRGQADGSINSPGVHVGNQHSRGNPVNTQDSERRPVTDFASYEELTGYGAGIYHMTDSVSDEDFGQALEEAKAEGNLSRKDDAGPRARPDRALGPASLPGQLAASRSHHPGCRRRTRPTRPG